MFKSVLIVIFVVIMLFVIRSVMQRLKKPESNQNSPSKPAQGEDTVQCLHCGTFIPRSDAIIKGNKAFCSAQHFNDWNQKH